MHTTIFSKDFRKINIFNFRQQQTNSFAKIFNFFNLDGVSLRRINRTYLRGSDI